jgi:hypothetical protein
VNFVDFILNLAALLLWVSWRVANFTPPPPVGTVSLASTLKPMEPAQSNRWMILFALLGLLTGRSLFYWQVGQQWNWIPNLRLVVLSLPFRSDRFDLMLLYSLLSCLLLVAVFFSWLLLLSAINHRLAPDPPWHRGVRQFLGWLENLPAVLKPLIFPIAAALAWRCLVPFLYKSPPASAILWEQSGIVALAALLAWKYLLLGLFALHLLNTYLYLGSQSFWKYINETTTTLLRPFGWLRFGQIDLAPVLGIALVCVGGHYAAVWLAYAFERLH